MTAGSIRQGTELGDTIIVNPSRFWRAIAFLAGRTVEGGSARWTCGPLDIDQGGYVDTAGVADGLWWIEARASP